MRVFQNTSLYPSYKPRLRKLTGNCTTFRQRMDVLLDDRYGALHLLLPVLDRAETAFYAVGDDELIQRQWAREQGMSTRSSMADILLAQIEAHRTEVFYNLDPLRYGSAFLRRLPGSVDFNMAWRAAPSPRADFGGYDLMVCNFPSILASYRDGGLNAAYFAPAFDPVMLEYAIAADRPVDVLFVGGYTRHHLTRAKLLEAVAELRSTLRIELRLDGSRLNRLAESFLGRIVIPSHHRRPPAIQALALQPVFGRELYAAIGRAKIVLNGAIDMAGDDRGNMRCFEALGCGAALLSDAGNYPAGMEDGVTMRLYANLGHAIEVIQEMIGRASERSALASTGLGMIQDRYSKQGQWSKFQELVERH